MSVAVCSEASSSGNVEPHSETLHSLGSRKAGSGWTGISNGEATAPQNLSVFMIFS